MTKIAKAAVGLSLDGESIELEELARATAEFASILSEVDIAIAGRKSIRWELSQLRYASPAFIEATPRLLPGVEPTHADAVIAASISGLGQIERDGKRRPDHFTDKALRNAKGLSGHADNDQRVTVVGHGPRFETKRVAITQRVAAHVDKLIGVVERAQGAIEGRLETVSIHGGRHLVIYAGRVGRGVRCLCDEETLAILQKHLGDRVLLYGEVRLNAAGEILSIKVATHRILKNREDLPQASDILGLLQDDPIDPEALSSYLRGTHS